METESAKYTPPVTRETIQNATRILNTYKRSKINLERRIVENEQWWKMRHWDLIRRKKNTDPEPASAWLFNSIANKHADVMDNYPAPSILPRERTDIEAAKLLSKIVPTVLEYNGFEETYSDVWWYKLKNGTGCYGIFWNSSLYEGLGDIDIKQIDILNLFWESGIKDIQDSRNLFSVELVDTEILTEMYPHLKGKCLSGGIDIAAYLYDDDVDTANKCTVVDWYYKKKSGRKVVLHYCKYVGEHVLYASENDPLYAENGYYDHGKYPFVFDPLFIEEGTPCGFGYIDIMKDVQMYIDKLNQIIIRNALQAGKRRFFISDSSGVNEEEFSDWTKEFVHVAGNMDERNLKEITVSQLDSGVITLLNQKIEELKETSGNRDVSQGGTTSGVTAASAIAALQEAGSKLSRDMIKGSYRAFRTINYFIIDLISQFYEEGRTFRIASGGTLEDFVEFRKNMLGSELKNKRCIFDISVTSQKSSPFSRTAQNELAKELYAAGLFNPNNFVSANVCLGMMDFDGKDEVMSQLAEYNSVNKTIGELTQRIEKLTELVNRAYGTNIEGGGADVQSKGKNLLESLTKIKTPADYRLRAARKNIPME